MANTIYKYRVWCETDGKYEFIWSETPPTTCPTNTAHSINTTKTVVVDRREESLITIREENIATGGHYQASFERLVIPSGTPGTMSSFDFSFPHPISLLAAEWTNHEAMDDDEIKFIISPDTVVGTLASNVASGVSVLPVTQTVVDNVEVGYCIELYSASGVQCMGRCLDKDDENNTITVENATEQAFEAAWPTYVRMHIDMVRKGYLAGHGRVQLGEAKIGGSYIPAGTILRACYWNNSGTAKNLHFVLEYLY